MTDLLVKIAKERVARDIANMRAAVPPELNAIADVVLAYKPKPVSKPAKKRKRRARKLAKERENG